MPGLRLAQFQLAPVQWKGCRYPHEANNRVDRWFPHDHWRLYGCIRMLLLLAAACCLVVGLDKITTWLLK
jgi:hypothetical protein